jgi:hypothetical protein
MINFNAPIVLAGAAVKTTLSLMAPVLTWGMCLASLAVSSFAQANDSGRGRHKQLYAVPAPGTVVIDGQLDDWDLSGQVEMFVIQATRGTMNAKFAVMYDADAIYLSADINDPSPMMNMRDPRTDPGQGWNADSCQFRLTTDPKVGYPILDESTFKYKGKGDPTETRDDIVHLTLWHYSETGEPQLAMQQGMTYREPKNAPRGLVPQHQFQAKYLKRANGSGYSFEYRIPWTTLNAKAPLQARDVVASTVQFNYSRPDGQMTAGVRPGPMTCCVRQASRTRAPSAGGSSSFRRPATSIASWCWKVYRQTGRCRSIFPTHCPKTRNARSSSLMRRMKTFACSCRSRSGSVGPTPSGGMVATTTETCCRQAPTSGAGFTMRR